MSLAAAVLLSLSWPARPARAAMLPDRKYYYEDIFAPFYVKDDAEIYHARRPGAAPGSFAAKKAPGTYRVFLIGGSIAQRYGQSTGASSPVQALSRVLPGRKVEVLDAGMGGYDSYRDALIVEEVLQYSPDLIVLTSGHNEGFGSKPVPLWILHAQDRLQLITKFLADLRADEASRHPDASARERAFADNLGRMISESRKAGATVAVVVPPLNYRDAPSIDPDASEPPAQAVEDLRQGDLEGAQAALAGADGPLALFLKGRVDERAGRLDAAARDYQAALGEDENMPGRCGPRCAGVIRDAARREGAVLVDADAAFLRRSAPSAPGIDVFTDAVHWQRRFDGWLSAALIESLRAAGALPDPEKDDRVWSALDAKLGRPSGDDEADATLCYALNLAEQRESRRPWRAMAFLERLRERRPRWFKKPEKLLARAVKRCARERPWGGQSATPSLASLERALELSQ